MPPAPTRTFFALCLLLLAHAAWSGWQVPVALSGQSFPGGALGCALALLPGFAFALLGFTRPVWKELPYPNLAARADQLLGKGTYTHLFMKAGVLLIRGSAATLAGVLGLTHTLVLGLAESPTLASLFMLSCGVGMLCAFIGQTRRLASASDA